MKALICLITGATDGIGKETALTLARKGYAVFITGRNEAKCKDVVSEIKAINPSVDSGYFLSDFTKLKSVSAMADQILNTLPQIDVLINNAGTTYSSRQVSEEGIEQTFSTNHLAPFILTVKLIPLLKKAPKARIVTVSSGSHYQGHINFDTITNPKRYFVMGAYSDSKLANVLFTKQLTKLLKGSNITANCLHPGFVKTKIGNKNTNTFFGLVWTVMTNIGAISLQEGAATSVYLASSPDAEQYNGLYFDKSKPKTPSKEAQDEKAAEKLWKLSESLTNTYWV
jgi:NAD(P)-dependent dehydrogenase (short-subunit alcohol dehydrogenase family)